MHSGSPARVMTLLKTRFIDTDGRVDPNKKLAMQFKDERD